MRAHVSTMNSNSNFVADHALLPRTFRKASPASA